MFFASVGEPSDVELFRYFLARELGKTLADLEDMECAEYAGWISYYKVKQQQEDLAVKAAQNGRR